jgi:hypothetical protein
MWGKLLNKRSLIEASQGVSIRGMNLRCRVGHLDLVIFRPNFALADFQSAFDVFA